MSRLTGVGRIADVAGAAAGVPVLAAGAYLAALAALARRSRKPGAPGSGGTSTSDRTGPTRFTIVVPAHDEAAGIAATVQGLLGLDYPAGAFRVLVVADNCTDDTAARAMAAGADVLVRVDPDRRGKGWALELAFATVLQDGFTEAAAVVDADTEADPGLLVAFDRRIRAGERALQADYRVAEAETSWRTRLMRIAFAAFHEVRSLGRERLGVSCGLRGNGMCFTAAVLNAVPHTAHSIVEDLEYGIALGRAGIRVAYVHEAGVRSAMPADATTARSQRQRWEEGRARFRREQGPRLLGEAVVARDPVLADLAADVLVPPLGQLTALAVAGTAVGMVLGGPRSWTARVFGAGLLGISGHVGVAWRVSGTGVAGLADLARAPWYVAWKLVARRRPARRTGEWVRTARPPSSGTD